MRRNHASSVAAKTTHMTRTTGHTGAETVNTATGEIT